MKNIDLLRAAVIFLTCLTVCTLLNLYGPLANASTLAGALGFGVFIAAVVTAGLVGLGSADHDRALRR